jgi:hypothetical protein
MNEASKTLRITPRTVNTWPTFKDRTGQKFGRLTVLKYAGSDKYRNSYWACRCQCGGETVVPTSALTTGNTNSCGCIQREYAAARMADKKLRATWKSIKTHGLSDSPEYRSWRSMKGRCLNPTCPHFKYYGGRGIRVCERWRDSFESFLADLGPRPTLDHSLDRWPNNKDGNYSCGKCEDCKAHGWPMNCRWATDEQQGNNKRNNHLMTLNGETLSMAQWAKKMQISVFTLSCRLNEMGWSEKEAILTPILPHGRTRK